MNYIMLFFIILVATAIFVPLTMKSRARWSYRSKALLTENEKEFFARLVTALPECHVFPQVALGALLQTNVTGKNAFRARAAFSQKIADYVICDRDMKVLAVVELDDRTHSAGKDARRDAMLNQAGYRTIRWQSRKKPGADAIRSMVLQS